MDKMLEMIDEMMDKMCSEDRMGMMKKMLEKCSEGLTADEKKGLFRNIFANQCSTEPKDSADWEMMPQMVMSMMGMMCTVLMKDMMKGEQAPGTPQGGGSGRGPMMGMGKMGGMGGMGGPMKMMQQMMGQGASKNAPASSTDNTGTTTGTTTADDSG